MRTTLLFTFFFGADVLCKPSIRLDPVKDMYKKTIHFRRLQNFYHSFGFSILYIIFGGLNYLIGATVATEKQLIPWVIKCNSPTADSEVRAQLLCMEGWPALGNLQNNNSFRFRARIFKIIRSPGIDSNESVPPDYVAWRAGTTTLFLLGS